MRLRSLSGVAILTGMLMFVGQGCDSGSDVTVAPVTGEAKPTPPVPASELKGDARKAVGPGSSAKVGTFKKNPMDMAR